MKARIWIPSVLGLLLAVSGLAAVHGTGPRLYEPTSPDLAAVAMRAPAARVLVDGIGPGTDGIAIGPGMVRGQN